MYTGEYDIKYGSRGAITAGGWLNIDVIVGAGNATFVFFFFEKNSGAGWKRGEENDQQKDCSTLLFPLELSLFSFFSSSPPTKKKKNLKY